MQTSSQFETKDCPHYPQCNPENDGPCWQAFKAIAGMGVGMMANVALGGAPFDMDMNMNVNTSNGHHHHHHQQQAHVSMNVGVTGLDVNFNMGSPQMVISTPNVVIASPPVVIAAPPAVIYGDAIRMAVNRSAKIKGMTNDVETEFTVYTIEIETNMERFGRNQAFNVQRRYSEFKKFYEELSKKCNFLPAPFPKKDAFGRFKTNVVETRRVFFDKLVKTIASDPGLKRCPEFYKFIGY